MAGKPAKNETIRTETLTIRLPPSSRWCLELLARIRSTSVAAQVQDAVSEKLNIEISRLKNTNAGENSTELLRSFGLALHQALENPTASPYERVLHLRCNAPELLTRSEWQTIRLLEDLRLLRIVPIDEGDELLARYDPLVLRTMWTAVDEAAQTELDVDVLARLAADIEKAKQLAATLGSR
jgi:hypothetical protein